jgi:hypothetical protein
MNPRRAETAPSQSESQSEWTFRILKRVFAA